MPMNEVKVVEVVGVEENASEAGGEPPLRDLPRSLPILGLSDIVVFPGMTVPLLVESGPSIRLVDDVVDGERLVGLVLQKDPVPQNPTPDQLWTIGCVARVSKMLKFPDGTARIMVEGTRRFRIQGFSQESPYLIAEVDVLTEAANDSIELEALGRSAKKAFEQISEISQSIGDEVKVGLLNADAPGRIADLIAPHANLSLEDRQALLELPDPKDRLSRLLPLLNREVQLQTLGSKIQKDVADSMSRSQREFYLREQLRAVQRELGEDGGATEMEALAQKIEAAEMPEAVRHVARKELERLRQIPPQVAEHSIARNYLDWLVDMPWNRGTADRHDLSRAAKILDAHHCGLDKVKERLLEFLAVLNLNQKLKGPVLCLAGPPGVGKTSLGKSVAEALERKFGRVSLGGVRDEAEIRGHRRTYMGALPGRIIQMMRRLRSNNPVILLDELDKVGSDVRGDPAAALLEVLDPEQNKSFSDHFLDVPFDLSRVFFIATANWLEPIHPALRDRLEVLEIPSYTPREKSLIAIKHLVPRQIEEHGLAKGDVRMPSRTIEVLIRDYTREAGVRNLDREIGAVVRKVARKLVEKEKTPRPVVVNPGDVETMLGVARFQREPEQPLARSGMAMGLAWTPVGGELLVIEATRMAGAGRLLLTGSLGDVMKESAQIALSHLRGGESGVDLSEVPFEKLDLHIHVPSGAVPKDGPSAGITLVTALASLLSGQVARPDVAMTGEISLRGRVLPVGGIKEKVMAALRGGMKSVLLPVGNRKDWSEVPEEVRRRLKAHFVGTVSQVLRLALGSKPVRGN